jgi:hypothetical protein
VAVAVDLLSFSGVEDALSGGYIMPVRYDLNVILLRSRAEAHPLTVFLKTTWTTVVGWTPPLTWSDGVEQTSVVA